MMDRKPIGTENLKLIVNILISLVILLLCIFLVPRLVLFFMPFVIGWLISCIANPLVVFLERKLKIRRKAGTVVVIVCVIAAVSGLGYGLGIVLWRQISGFVQEIPAMWEAVRQDFDTFGAWIDHYIGVRSPKFADALNNLGNIIGEMITNLPKSFDFSTFEGMGSMVGNIASVLISIIMCMLSAYFFIADREWLGSFLNRLLPETVMRKYDVFASSLKQAVGGYFKAQFKIMIVIYIVIMIGLMIIGVNYAWLIGFGIAFLDMLPVFGTGTVLIPWAVIKIFSGNIATAVGMIVLYAVSLVVHQLIQPKLVGESVGLDPFTTLFFMFIGYKIKGVTGMIIAIPVGMILTTFYEAGAFDHLIWCMNEITNDIKEFCKIDTNKTDHNKKEKL